MPIDFVCKHRRMVNEGPKKWDLQRVMGYHMNGNPKPWNPTVQNPFLADALEIYLALTAAPNCHLPWMVLLLSVADPVCLPGRARREVGKVCRFLPGVVGILL